MEAVWQSIASAAAISAFVITMMALVEALHVYSKGAWARALLERPRAQYALAAILGATPGCLGVFSVVALFIHGRLSVGAMVAAGVASCGDEAFVMLALFPGRAVWIFGGLAAYGLMVGALTGWILPRHRSLQRDDCLAIHASEPPPLPGTRDIVLQWRRCTSLRAATASALVLMAAAGSWRATRSGNADWLPPMLALVAGLALVAVVFLPDHFIEAHLWRHVIRRHALRVFLWTAGALVLIESARQWIPTDGALPVQSWTLLLVACLVGLLPESGPHLVFVALYADGAIPLGVLMGSAVVQDGHGMLPLLAHSRTYFLGIKAVNFVAGLALGGLMLAANL